jgi:hypothetical protein
MLARLMHEINSALAVATGVGVEVAGQLLVTAGDNPRLHGTRGRPSGAGRHSLTITIY